MEPPVAAPKHTQMLGTARVSASDIKNGAYRRVSSIPLYSPFFTFACSPHVFGSVLLHYRKLILTYAAQRAYPVLRHILKSSSCRYTVVRIAHLGIVNIATYVTYIFLHIKHLSFLIVCGYKMPFMESTHFPASLLYQTARLITTNFPKSS